MPSIGARIRPAVWATQPVSPCCASGRGLKRTAGSVGRSSANGCVRCDGLLHSGGVTMIAARRRCIAEVSASRQMRVEDEGARQSFLTNSLKGKGEPKRLGRDGVEDDGGDGEEGTSHAAGAELVSSAARAPPLPRSCSTARAAIFQSSTLHFIMTSSLCQSFKTQAM